MRNNWGRRQCLVNVDGLIHNYTNENKWEDNSDEDCIYNVSFRELDLCTNIAIKNSALVGLLIQRNFDFLMLTDINSSHLLIFSNSLFMWEEVVFAISKDVINVVSSA